MTGLNPSGLHQWLFLVPSWFTDGPTSIFSPKGTPAHFIFGLSMFVLAITAAIFLTAGGVLALCPDPLSPARHGFRITNPRRFTAAIRSSFPGR